MSNIARFVSPFMAICAATCVPVRAGTWATQAVLASNAYSGTVTVDSSGNTVGVWYQNALPSGAAVNEIWASTGTIGGLWSAPVNISGLIGVASGSPSVRGSANGNVTAIYTSPSTGDANYVEHRAGGSWGTPGATNGLNQFYIHNDQGDEGLAWSTGGARASSSTVATVKRSSGGSWTPATTIATGVHLAFDGAVIAPDGTMAVAWESFDSTCGSRTCKTSNWVLHVSTAAPGTNSWVDSGPLLGPDATQHFTQLAADNSGRLGAIGLQGSNLVSRVRQGGAWSSTAVVAPLTAIGFYTGTGHDNRVFGSDSTGNATVVSWNAGLTSLVEVDGNLATNTWGAVTAISGPDQNPNYFDFAISSSGAAIAFWSISSNGKTRSGEQPTERRPAWPGTPRLQSARPLKAAARPKESPLMPPARPWSFITAIVRTT